MTDGALHVRDLVCGRGGVPILAGVAFRIAPGAALILRGPNGSGKTTLLRTVAGLSPPLAGKVAAPPVAYAGHADGIKGQATVAENLSFWARVFDRRDIDDALDAFALAPLRDRRAGTLSAGQRRRLGLARLMVTGRPLWCLDEPTVSLDAGTTARFAGILGAHLAAGGLALIATHIDLGLDAPAFEVAPFAATHAALAHPDPFAGDVW